MNKTPIASRALSFVLAAMVTFSILAGIDTLAYQPIGSDALMASVTFAASAA